MKVAALPRQKILSRCLELAGSSPSSHILTFNALMARLYWRRSDFREAVKNADLVVCDSIGIKTVVFLGEKRLVSRYPGIEIMEEIVKRGIKSFFWGGGKTVALQAAEKIKEKYPRADICGARSGYFSPEEEKDIIKEIKSKNPGAVFVGLNIPDQEVLINRIKCTINRGVIMGVGGSFDVLSGTLRRSPGIFIYTGMEWLWRLLIQPWRLKRIITLPLFLLEASWRIFKGQPVFTE